MPRSNVGSRDVRSQIPIPEAVAQEYENRLFTLLEGFASAATAPKMLSITDPAREAWVDLAEEIERQQDEGGRLGSISDWTSKLPGATGRMAALIEHAEVDDESIVCLQIAADAPQLLAERSGNRTCAKAQTAPRPPSIDCREEGAGYVLARHGWN
jgi:hypothetical protein